LLPSEILYATAQYGRLGKLLNQGRYPRIAEVLARAFLYALSHKMCSSKCICTVLKAILQFVITDARFSVSMQRPAKEKVEQFVVCDAVLKNYL